MPMRLIAQIIFLALLLSGCDMCGNDPLNVVTSPNGEMNAISFVRSCGATTGYSTHVSITDKSGRLKNDPGNIFTIEGKSPVGIEWKNNSQLIVDIDGSGKEFKMVAEFEGVKVEYK